jgi:2-C-methyl-D-erythritol 4-phosphate cytidylyltransferase
VSALSREVDLVLIHDAARPLATADLMCEGLRFASSSGAAIAAIPVRDTIKEVAPDGVIERTPDRVRLYAAQTPQVFRRDWLEESYRKLHVAGAELAFSDEAGLLEWAGYRVSIFPGSPENIKLTYPIDLLVADAILRSRRGIDQ